MNSVNDILDSTILGYKVRDLLTCVTILRDNSISPQDLKDMDAMYLKGFMDASALVGSELQT